MAPAVVAATVTTLTAVTTVDVGGGGALGLASLSDAGENRERATQCETTDGDANQLVHGVHLSHGLTSRQGAALSLGRGTSP